MVQDVEDFRPKLQHCSFIRELDFRIFDDRQIPFRQSWTAQHVAARASQKPDRTEVEPAGLYHCFVVLVITVLLTNRIGVHRQGEAPAAAILAAVLAEYGLVMGSQVWS